MAKKNDSIFFPLPFDWGAGAVVSHGGNYTLSSMLMVGLLLLQILKPGKGLMLSSPFHVCVTFITTFD